MTDGHVLHRRFLRLAGPNILSNLLVPIASAIDVALLGHLADLRDLAGVALATVVFDYVLWTFGFLRMATTGLTAQARGRDDIQEERLIAMRAMSLGLALGLAVLVVQWPLREIGFLALQGNVETEISARAYFDARIWGAPFTLANYALLGWLLGREQAGRALIMSAVGHGTNIGLDIWFIGGLGWGAAGAGAATALSQVTMFGVAIVLVAPALPIRSIRPLLGQMPDRSALRAFFSLGLDITIRTLLLISTFAIFTNIAAMMGMVVLAATAVLRQVVMLAAWFIDGYAFAVESLVGVFAGRRDRKSLVAVLRVAMIWGLATATVFALAFLVAPRPLLGILVDHDEVMALLMRTVGWLLPVLVLSAPAYVLDGCFLGLAAGPILRRTMLISVVIGFVPLAIAALSTNSIHLLWAALSCFMLARTITLGREVRGALARISD